MPEIAISPLSYRKDAREAIPNYDPGSSSLSPLHNYKSFSLHLSPNLALALID